MFLDIQNKFEELKKTIKELKECGVVALKVSTERGHNFEFIDFVTNKLLDDDVLPVEMKIGGPSAKNDILEGLRIGVPIINAPMIESPYAVNNFVIKMRGLAGEELMSNLILTLNIETVTAFKQFDEILTAREIKWIDRVGIGAGDLCHSVEKTLYDPYVFKMIKEMASKVKKAGKVLRIGGLHPLIHGKEKLLSRLFDEVDPDLICSSGTIMDFNMISDLTSSFLQSENFQKKLDDFWFVLCNKRLERLAHSRY